MTAAEPFVPPSSDFGMLLRSWNALAGSEFAAWDFVPGMRFAERAAWWRDGADRGDAHEGLDICWYLSRDGRRSSLGAGARVPVIYGGEVVSVAADFLGVSLFVAHEHRDGRGRQLHTVYGHIRPREGLVPGSLIAAGDAVGAIADTCGRTSFVPPHLHISMALIARDGGPKRLDWEALRDRSRALLLDPMIIMKR